MFQEADVAHRAALVIAIQNGGVIPADLQVYGLAQAYDAAVKADEVGTTRALVRSSENIRRWVQGPKAEPAGTSITAIQIITAARIEVGPGAPELTNGNDAGAGSLQTNGLRIRLNGHHAGS